MASVGDTGGSFGPGPSPEAAGNKGPGAFSAGRGCSGGGTSWPDDFRPNIRVNVFIYLHPGATLECVQYQSTREVSAVGSLSGSTCDGNSFQLCSTTSAGR